MKNKLFYFFSWERYNKKAAYHVHLLRADREDARGRLERKVAAALPTFKLYNPFSDRTGDGAGTVDE